MNVAAQLPATTIDRSGCITSCAAAVVVQNARELQQKIIEKFDSNGELQVRKLVNIDCSLALTWTDL